MNWLVKEFYGHDPFQRRWGHPGGAGVICIEKVEELFNVPPAAVRLRFVVHDEMAPNRIKIRYHDDSQSNIYGDLYVGDREYHGIILVGLRRLLDAYVNKDIYVEAEYEL